MGSHDWLWDNDLILKDLIKIKLYQTTTKRNKARPMFMFHVID